MYNALITVAAIITAITTIVLPIKKGIEHVKNKRQEDEEFKIKIFNKLDNLEDEIKEVKKDTKENKLYILKDVVRNERLTLEERIHAGDEYVQMGGNGYIKEIYHDLLNKVHKKE